jgi:type I restriction enzyme, S subunit
MYPDSQCHGICNGKSLGYCNATGAGLPRISIFNVAQLKIVIPPLSEQTAIAAYLDTKTAQIDRQLDLFSQKATQYGKLKQSLINETVIRGLDKTVPMKNSGVEWIREVPEHWEIQRIGTAFEERSEKVNDTDYPPLSVSMAGIVPQMESVAKTDNNENRKRVAVGDYVINSRSDRRGASGISIYDGSVSVISIVLAPNRSFFGKYLHHLFRSYSFIEEFYRVGRGIVDDLWTTRYSVMKGIEFSFPSYDEQKLIADYLDTKTAQIDRILTTINSQIEKLKELRKVLINDVVTGKIKVMSEEQDYE